MFTIDIRHDTRITVSLTQADLNVLHAALVSVRLRSLPNGLTNDRVGDLIACMEDALEQARTDDVTIKTI